MDKDNWNPYEIISKALARGRLAHAYIISGNSPQAREQFIQDVAMLLLCTSPGARGESPLEPCGRCKSCHKAMKGIHPDLTEIRPRNRSIRIDQIKALQEQVLFPPLEAKRRIIAIHEADCLNPASANALLKLLEEPPQNNVLLLSVASPAGLLPTIVSRCQTLRIGESVAGDSLRERALKDISPDERAFADYVVTNLSVLKQEDIERLLDIRKRVAQFLGNRRDVLSMLALCAFLSSSRQQVEDTITILRLFLRDMFILRQGVSGQDMNILINRDMASLLGQLAQRNNYDTLEGYERVLAKAEAMLDRNVKPEMVTDMLLLFWLQLA